VHQVCFSVRVSGIPYTMWMLNTPLCIQHALCLCAESCVKGALYSQSQLYIYSGWLFGMCPAWVLVWIELSGMKYFEEYLFTYSQSFCLLAWAPQLLLHSCCCTAVTSQLLLYICSYGIFVGCWLYSLSAACINLYHSCYSSCLMEMLPWSSIIIIALDDVSQNVTVPSATFPAVLLQAQMGESTCRVYVRVPWSIDQRWTPMYALSLVHQTACCVMSNNTAEMCCTTGQWHAYRKSKLSGCTVFSILHLSILGVIFETLVKTVASVGCCSVFCTLKK
jgi:hypothetical protein